MSPTTKSSSKSSAREPAILYACVAAGGILGSVARYLASLLIPAVSGFPYPTLFVNVTGSFVAAFLLIPVLLVIMAGIIWFYSPENARKELNEIAV